MKKLDLPIAFVSVLYLLAFGFTLRYALVYHIPTLHVVAFLIVAVLCLVSFILCISVVYEDYTRQVKLDSLRNPTKEYDDQPSDSITFSIIAVLVLFILATSSCNSKSGDNWKENNVPFTKYEAIYVGVDTFIVIDAKGLNAEYLKADTEGYISDDKYDSMVLDYTYNINSFIPEDIIENQHRYKSVDPTLHVDWFDCYICSGKESLSRIKSNK